MKPTTKEIGYAYPSSKIAAQLGRSGQGCWFIKINPGMRFHGAFATLDEAEKFADTHLPDVSYGYWSRRTNPENERWRVPTKGLK